MKIYIVLVLFASLFLLGCTEPEGPTATPTAAVTLAPTATPTPLPVSARLEELSKPVVYVVTLFEGNYSLPKPVLNKETLVFEPTSKIDTEEFSYAIGSGSGLIVSSDGLVLTNDHVIAFTEEDLHVQYQAYLEEQIWNVLDLVIRQELEGQGETGQRVLDTLQMELPKYLNQYLVFSDVKKTIYVSSKEMGSWNMDQSSVKEQTISDLSLLVAKAEVLKEGDPGGGRDVAVLKIKGRNLPTLKLGDSDAVRIGDEVWSIGFPGASESEMFSASELTKPTATNGVISAERQTKTGLKILQTNAAISYGNSGGPVLNDKGEVIGLATFVSVDPTTGAQVPGFAFLVPSNTANGFLR